MLAICFRVTRLHGRSHVGRTIFIFMC